MKKLPLWRELCYSSGSFSGGIVGTAFGSWLMFFYIDTLHFNAGAIGVSMVIYAVWNAVNDPLMGYISDRTRSRWGRRIPYVLFGTIPLMVAFFLVFSPPMDLLQSSFSQILYFTLSICIYDTFFTTVLLNWTSVVPEMYPQERDRNRLLGISQVFGIVGAMVGTVAVEPLVKAFGWSAMAAIFAVVGVVTMLIAVFGMREDPNNRVPEAIKLVDSFKYTLKSKSFLLCVFSVLFVESARTMLLAALPFYADYVLGQDFAYTILVAAILLAAIVLTPLVVFISNKKGAKHAYIFSLMVFTAGCFLFFFSPNLTSCIVIGVLMGFGVTGAITMPNVLLGQVIDEDQTVTGLRREGAYFGINALIMRLSVAFQSVAMTAILTLTGYDSSSSHQSATVVTGIKSLMSFVPAAFILIALAFAYFYPLYGNRLIEVRSKIEQLMQASEK